MGPGVNGKCLSSFPQLGLVLVWTLCALPYGRSVEQQVTQFPDNIWAQQATVFNLSVSKVSNDGNATILANLTASGCPTGVLSLVFPEATPAGADVTVPGKMDSQCKTVAFRAVDSAGFRGIQPNKYLVRLELGTDRQQVSFATRPAANSQGNNDHWINSSGILLSSTTLITVVKAATADFIGQSSSTCRTRAMVTLTVGLDGPAELPTSLGLRVWDSSAVEIEPASQTWLSGESDNRNFTLWLKRAAPSGYAVPWAELVHAENVLFKTNSSPRLEIQAPKAKFSVAYNQVLYRSPTDPVSSDRNSNSTQASKSDGEDGDGGLRLSALASASSSALGSFPVEVRRMSSSPFRSTLQYKATVLTATGCITQACNAAVSGIGILEFLADDNNIPANVTVNWGALPAEAMLSVEVQWTPIDNAELFELPVSFNVYGTTYGTCPAGTMGPWREPVAPTVLQSVADATPSLQVPSAPVAVPLRSGNKGAPSSQVAASPLSENFGQPPGSATKSSCNATAMFRPLLDYVTAAAMLPVMSACAGGDVRLVEPTHTAAPTVPSSGPSSDSGALDATTTPAATPAVPEPKLAHTPSGNVGDSIAATPVELLMPYDQVAVSIFIPLGGSDETVVVLNTTCSPKPKLVQQVKPSTSPGGSAAAWAEMALPTSLQMCYVLLRVYGSVWSGQPTQQQEQAQGNSGSATGATLPWPQAAGGGKPSHPRGAKAAQGDLRPLGAPKDATPPPAESHTNGSVSPVSSTGARPAASLAPPPVAPLPANPGGISLPVLSMVQLRTFNVTLRPLSDPDVFSASALALYLLHRPSGRCLPLCGLPQPMLRAATSMIFGDAFDAASQTQLGAAAVALVLAIRGDANAVAQLQAAARTYSDLSDGDATTASGRRRWLRVGEWLRIGESFRRRLAAWLPSGSGKLAAPRGGPDAVIDAGGVASDAFSREDRRAKAWLREGITRQLAAVVSFRRLLHLSSIPPSPPSPDPVRVSAPSSNAADPSPEEPVPAAAIIIPPGNPPSLAPSSSPHGIPNASPRLQTSPAAQPPSTPRSSPTLPALPGSMPSNGTGPSYPGTPPSAATAPDGFDLIGAGSFSHVLLNPEFVDWCHASDPLVVNLALLAGPYELELVASSRGLELQLGAAVNGNDVDVATIEPMEVLLGPTTRLALLQAQEDSARGGQGADAGAGDDRRDDVGGVSEAAAKCFSVNPLQEADKRVTVLMVAPDGVTTAPLDLRLFVDFETTAVAAALRCQNNSQSTQNTTGSSTIDGNSTGGIGAGNNTRSSGAGEGTDSGAADVSNTSRPSARVDLLAPSAPALTAKLRTTPSSQSVYMSLSAPAPLPVWAVCRPCGPGSFSDVTNATVCQLCSPGSISNGTYNKVCTPCNQGMFTVHAGSMSCRPCYAGTYAPRSGSAICSPCPSGTTSLLDGASDCVVPRQPAKGDVALVVSFRVVLNMSAAGNSSVAQAASATGMSDAPADSIFRMLIAADTAAALRIPPSMVRVSLFEVSPSTFLVNVSATMPLDQTTSSGTGTGTGSSPAGSPGVSPEVDADTLISRLVDNPDNSFPRTREATGGSLQVQYVQRQVVVLDAGSGSVNPHVVVWPTLAGTGLLAMVLGLACRRYCRRRRARLGLSLPPISDASDSLCAWKQPTSPPPVAYLGYNRFISMELQEASITVAARHRPGRTGSKFSLPALGLTLTSDFSDIVWPNNMAMETDDVGVMYTREAAAAPRI